MHNVLVFLEFVAKERRLFSQTPQRFVFINLNIQTQPGAHEKTPYGKDRYSGI